MSKYIDIYTDGATFGHNGALGTVSKVGVGIWIPDYNIECARALDGQSNNEAEFLALIHACIIAHNLNITHPSFHLDSQIVVGRAQGKRPLKPKYYNGRMNMFQDILIGLLEGFADHKIEWIPREQNAKADALSKRSFWGSGL